MRGVAVGGTLQPPVVSPGPVIGDQVSESSQSDSLVGRKGGRLQLLGMWSYPSLPPSLSLFQHPGVDSQMLDEEIKAVMTVRELKGKGNRLKLMILLSHTHTHTHTHTHLHTPLPHRT